MFGPRFLAALAAVFTVSTASAETLRVATYNVDLSREGPGELLHDLGQEPDARLAAVLGAIKAVRPDILLLNKFDHDLRGRALAALLDLLRSGPDGIDYGHSYHPPVNAGIPSGFDLDGDGLIMGWNDARGYGKFPGHGGMALLSRLPIDADAARTFREFLWSEMPEALLPEDRDGSPFPSAAAQAALPLSSRAHWDVPVLLPGGEKLHLLAAHPTPPLFDGEEGMNRKRNHDEIVFWVRYLDGASFRDDQGRVAGAPDAPLVVLGDLNADPQDGAGLRDGITRLLAHPSLQDVRPASRGAAEAARDQGGANAAQTGPPELDTADWRDAQGPGNLRVDYVLPSKSLVVAGAGVHWPERNAAMGAAIAAGPPHRVVWVDIEMPSP